MSAVRITADGATPQYHLVDAHGNHFVVKPSTMLVSRTPAISLGDAVMTQQGVTDLLPALMTFASTGQLS